MERFGNCKEIGAASVVLHCFFYHCSQGAFLGFLSLACSHGFPFEVVFLDDDGGKKILPLGLASGTGSFK